MAVTRLTATIKIAWWLRLYLHGLFFTMWLMGREPDMKKVERWLRWGVTVELDQ